MIKVLRIIYITIASRTVRNFPPLQTPRLLRPFFRTTLAFVESKLYVFLRLTHPLMMANSRPLADQAVCVCMYIRKRLPTWLSVSEYRVVQSRQGIEKWGGESGGGVNREPGRVGWRQECVGEKEEKRCKIRRVRVMGRVKHRIISKERRKLNVRAGTEYRRLGKRWMNENLKKRERKKEEMMKIVWRKKKMGKSNNLM